MERCEIKCVVVGDGEVGKTSLLLKFTDNEFLNDYIPTVFEDSSKDVWYDGNPYTMKLFDTAGNEGYETIRPLIYPNTDVFIICFSVIFPNSFENVVNWVSEINHFKKYTPFLLVGTKIDQRNNSEVISRLRQNGRIVINTARGQNLAKKIKAFTYLECSALTNAGVSDVFGEAIRAAIRKPQAVKRKCSIM